MKITPRLKAYIKDFFQDSQMELEFYQGILQIEQSNPQQSEEVLNELKEIIDELEAQYNKNSLFCPV